MRDRWFPTNTPPPAAATHAATLAHRILFALNSYPGPMRLVTGAPGQDDDFWVDSTRGWVPRSPVAWQHGSQNREYWIVRAARVPYLVQSRRPGGGGQPNQFLDHLLVGYSDAAGPLAGGQAWNTNAGPPALARLGTFLVEDLWPGASGTARAVPNWDQSITGQAEGWEKVPGPPSRPWVFREQTITPDETVRVTLASDTGERRYLLVGYEGGGGW
jgi:hypothetical protein